MKPSQPSHPKSSINDITTKKVFYSVAICCLVLLSNGAYLATTDLAENLLGYTIQNVTYQYMFALHLLLGVLTMVMIVVYVFRHIRRARRCKNTRAAKKGQQLTLIVSIVFITGLLLTRGFINIDNHIPYLRSLLYSLHIILPIAGLWLYLQHRKSGNNKKQALGRLLIPILLLFGIGPLVAHLPVLTQEEKLTSNTEPPVSYFPSLIKTTHSGPVEEQTLLLTEYCQQCHQDSHERWSHSAHRYSSFNNPFYRMSVMNLRQNLKNSNKNLAPSRFCAGCHDPIPLLSGNFDKADFNVDTYPSASAGLTCTVCHSISSIDSPRGNSDFTITPPEHYPFAFSKSASLRWFSDLLIKSNPDFHKRTFLKPLHSTSEFCGSCHKVHIPPEVNNYRWLRGQNHYDSFLLSGVSGHSVSSFYYPSKAVNRCASCHMQPMVSNEFGAKRLTPGIIDSQLQLHDHLFPAANTALNASLEGNNADTLKIYQDFLSNVALVDIIGFREDGRTDGKFMELGNTDFHLTPGKTYLIEVVIRTKKVGHLFTQGTADSNQIWLQLEVHNDKKIIADHGSINPLTGEVDADSHNINLYLIDKDGNRINRRNAEDIHTTLYNNQIPPGAADVIHYQYTVPNNISGTLSLKATLNYRKFNSEYYRLATGKPSAANPLPIIPVHTQTTVIPLTSSVLLPATQSLRPRWERLNDYGIALFRKPGKAQYKQAEKIFKRVQNLGRQEGILNLARLYYHEGRLEEASLTLGLLDNKTLTNPWTATWYSALINRDNGFLDESLALFAKLIKTDWPAARERHFDFSYDYRLLNAYAVTLFTRARLEKRDSPEYNALIKQSERWYKKVLTIDPENTAAHFGLFKVYKQLGNTAQAKHHRARHAYYKTDDSAKNLAIGLAREKDPYANKTANSVVIYNLKETNNAK